MPGAFRRARWRWGDDGAVTEWADLAASPRTEPTLSVPASDRPVVVIVASAFDAVERIRRALGSEYTIARCATLTEARGVQQAGRVAGAILEPQDRTGAATAVFARELRGTARAPVLALVRRSAPWCAATVALLEAHPDQVLVVEDLDLGSVVRALSTRLRRAEFVSAVWGELEADVPEGLRPLVRIALSQAAGPLSVQEIADAMGLHRKTLWSRCRRHGLGNVQALMTWCRLLAAAHALRSCSRPIDTIAEELAFASPTALRNAVRRHLGTTPSALRADGGEKLAYEEFRAWMRRLQPPPAVTLGDVA